MHVVHIVYAMWETLQIIYLSTTNYFCHKIEFGQQIIYSSENGQTITSNLLLKFKIYYII